MSSPRTHLKIAGRRRQNIGTIEILGHIRLGPPEGDSGGGAGLYKALAYSAFACSVVTSSRRLPQSFVLRLRKTLARLSGRDVRSMRFLCSSATIRIDFFPLVSPFSGLSLSRTGGAAGYSAVVGEPPEVASMTGMSRSCSGKTSSNRSYTSSAAGRGAHVYSLSVKVLPRCRIFPLLGVRGASLRSEWGGSGAGLLATGCSDPLEEIWPRKDDGG